MKLEVGRFVRTKDGEIHKIKSIVTKEQMEQMAYKVVE